MYSDPYYMTMVGDAGQLPDFSNPTTLRSAATGLHNAFGLDPTYPVTSINVLKEGGGPVAATTSRKRQLLQSGKQVIILGYAFAQPEARQKLPDAAALKQTVPAAAGKITASLASVGVLSKAAVASIVVGLLAPETTPLDVQNLLKEAPAAILQKLEKLRGKGWREAAHLGLHGESGVCFHASPVVVPLLVVTVTDVQQPRHAGGWTRHKRMPCSDHASVSGLKASQQNLAASYKLQIPGARFMSQTDTQPTMPWAGQ